MYISRHNIEELANKIDLWYSFGRVGLNEIRVRGYLDGNNVLKFATNKETIPEVKSGGYYYFLRDYSHLTKLVIEGYKDVVNGELSYDSYIRMLLNEIETFYRSRGYDTIVVN